VVDESYKNIQAFLGAIILGYLRIRQQTAPDKLQLIVGAYNNTIKARAMDDDEFFDSVCDLVRVSTDRGQITMTEYLAKSATSSAITERAPRRRSTNCSRSQGPSSHRRKLGQRRNSSKICPP
jgi:HSP90 family molecular chaperone